MTKSGVNATERTRSLWEERRATVCSCAQFSHCTVDGTAAADALGAVDQPWVVARFCSRRCISDEPDNTHGYWKSMEASLQMLRGGNQFLKTMIEARDVPATVVVLMFLQQMSSLSVPDPH